MKGGNMWYFDFCKARSGVRVILRVGIFVLEVISDTFQLMSKTWGGQEVCPKVDTRYTVCTRLRDLGLSSGIQYSFTQLEFLMQFWKALDLAFTELYLVFKSSTRQSNS